MDCYNADYYERGLESGVSLYTNYRWIPELTIPMAMTMIDFLGIKRNETILEVGCSKGYLVKAFRLLYRQAWGIDVSEYAISNADSSVKDFCFLKQGKYLSIPPEKPIQIPGRFDYCVCKDVLEHMKESELVELFTNEIEVKKKIFAVIPLGDENGYFAPSNNLDKTHVLCRDSGWWCDFFFENGYEIDDFRFVLTGIKDSYYEKYPHAHGFFTLRNK